MIRNEAYNFFLHHLYEGKIGRPTYHRSALRIDEVVRSIFPS
jgi:hypothetical protein